VTADMTADELLPAVRDLYARLPETRCLRAWELRHALWPLGYTEALEAEHEIEGGNDP
jgi:hypothetical protein